MKERLDRHNLKVILVQIDEAHSSAWPKSLENQPEPQKNFQDRIDRANHYVEVYSNVFPVYIDNWSNEFAELFRAWPDKYHCIDSNYNVIAKSEYGTNQNEALIVKDYVVLLEELMQN